LHSATLVDLICARELYIMNCTAEINVVQARIQVLSAHLAGGPPRASGAVKVSVRIYCPLCKYPHPFC